MGCERLFWGAFIEVKEEGLVAVRHLSIRVKTG